MEERHKMSKRQMLKDKTTKCSCRKCRSRMGTLALVVDFPRVSKARNYMTAMTAAPSCLKNIQAAIILRCGKKFRLLKTTAR